MLHGIKNSGQNPISLCFHGRIFQDIEVNVVFADQHDFRGYILYLFAFTEKKRVPHTIKKLTSAAHRMLSIRNFSLTIVDPVFCF
jgi:hypothetical protein